jgi:hypothetical protein
MNAKILHKARKEINITQRDTEKLRDTQRNGKQCREKPFWIIMRLSVDARPYGEFIANERHS